MESAAIAGGVQVAQGALYLLSSLQLLAYLWPQQAVVRDGDKYDFIIVGAGTAGSVIANRLTENESARVLLIEAGGDPPYESDLPATVLFLKRSRFDWNYTSIDDHRSDQCHQHPYFEMSLGKMLGGTSSLNYMVHTRGQPEDYDAWAQITQDSTWKWNNVLKYFIKSEKLEVPEILNSPHGKYHGTNGYVGITKEDSGDVTNYYNAFKELGNDIVADLNPDHPLGYTDFLVTLSDGHRQSSATCYLSAAKDRPNLHVLKNTLVTKVVIEGTRAIGVKALTEDGKTITIKAEKEVIVSGGVFNTPKLLMLSGIGPKEHLKSMNIDVIKDLPVGENLQDHVAVVMIHNMEVIEKPLLPIDPRKFPAISFKGLVAINKTKTDADYLTINYVVGADIVLYFCSFGYRFNHQICDNYFKSGTDRIVLFSEVLNITPESRGKVLLRSSNPEDPPEILTGYFSKDEDVEKMIDFVEDFAKIINTTYFKSVNAEFVDPLPTRCQEFTPGSREYWRCYSLCISSSMSEFTSTCAMGLVLDGRLRVYGVKGLRVADASVMPTIPRANPVATVFMIGEKAAAFIKEEYKM